MALAVVALGLSAAFVAMGQSSRSAEQLRVRTLAHWAASDALTALRLAQEVPRTQRRRQEEVSGRLWWVEYRVQETDAENLRDVEVVVRSGRNTRPLAAARSMVRLPAVDESTSVE